MYNIYTVVYLEGAAEFHKTPFKLDLLLSSTDHRLNGTWLENKENCCGSP